MQGATDHYQVLLDQGAAVPGSPAEARLTRLIHDSGEVLAKSYAVMRTMTRHTPSAHSSKIRILLHSWCTGRRLH